ncbi:Hypothetical protein OINT_2001685 [Brucella intermedia LMG 3301]|uniref:Uncharacterized protein n=1 Tax=Brucella intermedia LMG 3301 TaxID=641118 RepID=C4WQB4_9HYPH|nr:Hypothetical protein OINT_2001685 [Brucella intermedia LMG 3301]
MPDTLLLVCPVFSTRERDRTKDVFRETLQLNKYRLLMDVISERVIIVFSDVAG